VIEGQYGHLTGNWRGCSAEMLSATLEEWVNPNATVVVAMHGSIQTEAERRDRLDAILRRERDLRFGGIVTSAFFLIALAVLVLYTNWLASVVLGLPTLLLMSGIAWMERSHMRGCREERALIEGPALSLAREGRTSPGS
jgi:hypothetical protein